jgi:hypothetical protein
MRNIIFIFCVALLACEKGADAITGTWVIEKQVNTANGSETPNGNTTVTFNENGTYNFSNISETGYYIADDKNIYFGNGSNKIEAAYRIKRNKMIIYYPFTNGILYIDPAANTYETHFTRR